MELFTNKSIVRAMGKTQWEVGVIPYAKTYNGKDPPQASLANYVRCLHVPSKGVSRFCVFLHSSRDTRGL